MACWYKHNSAGDTLKDVLVFSGLTCHRLAGPMNTTPRDFQFHSPGIPPLTFFGAIIPVFSETTFPHSVLFIIKHMVPW